jgi:hypothetical protein
MSLQSRLRGGSDADQHNTLAVQTKRAPRGRDRFTERQDKAEQSDDDDDDDAETVDDDKDEDDDDVHASLLRKRHLKRAKSALPAVSERTVPGRSKSFRRETVQLPFSARFPAHGLGLIMDLATLELAFVHLFLNILAVVEMFKTTSAFSMRTWRIFVGAHLGLLGALTLAAVVVNLMQRSTSPMRRPAIGVLFYLIWQALWAVLLFNFVHDNIATFDMSDAEGSDVPVSTRFADLGQPPLPLAVLIHIRWERFLLCVVLSFMLGTLIYALAYPIGLLLTYARRLGAHLDLAPQAEPAVAATAAAVATAAPVPSVHASKTDIVGRTTVPTAPTPLVDLAASPTRAAASGMSVQVAASL